MPAIEMVSKEHLVDALRKSREQFAFYGKQHRDKVPKLEEQLSHPLSDRDRKDIEDQVTATRRKAAVNEMMAKMIDDLIGPPGEAVRSPDTKGS